MSIVFRCESLKDKQEIKIVNTVDLRQSFKIFLQSNLCLQIIRQRPMVLKLYYQIFVKVYMVCPRQAFSA